MNKYLSHKGLVLSSIILFCIMAVVNALSASGLINGYSQKAISELFPTTITPAGYAFSIWGVIYFLLFCSLLVLYFNSHDKYHVTIIKYTTLLFWLSCLCNIAWIFAFSYQIIWLSAILIIAILISLLAILYAMQRRYPNEKSLFDIVIGLYAGWLFVATLVNIAAFFVSIDVSFFETHTIFYAFVFLLAVLGAFFLEKIIRNPFFHLAISWAYIAIMVALGLMQSTIILFASLVIGLIALLVLIFISFTRVTLRI